MTESCAVITDRSGAGLTAGVHRGAGRVVAGPSVPAVRRPRVGARWLVAGLIALWCLALVPLVGSVGFVLLVACRVLLGLAEGPASAVATHVVHTWFVPARRALPTSLIFTGVALGPLLAAPTLTWVITAYDWHMAFLVLVVAGVVLGALWLLLGRSDPVDAARPPLADTATGVRLPDRVPWRLLTRPTTACRRPSGPAGAHLRTVGHRTRRRLQRE